MLNRGGRQQCKVICPAGQGMQFSEEAVLPETAGDSGNEPEGSEDDPGNDNGPGPDRPKGPNLRIVK